MNEDYGCGWSVLIICIAIWALCAFLRVGG